MAEVPSITENRLSKGSLWALLTRSERELLIGSGTTQDHSNGTTVMCEGEATVTVHVLLRGKAKVVTTSVDGCRSILAVRRPGDVLGELAAIDGKRRSATVIAMSEITDLRIAAQRFKTLMADHPAITQAVLTVMAGRLREAASQRTESGDSTAAQRLESQLLEFVEQFGATDQDGVVVVPFTQDELAASIGASRQTVVRALGNLREKGVIETKRQRIVILRPDLLKRRT